MQSNDFIYSKCAKFRYIGNTNEAFIQDRFYWGSFLIFPQATICCITKGGGGATHKAFQTLTKNWETSYGKEIISLAENKEY